MITDMKKFIWEDKYSIGVDSIDQQHQQFFKIANSVLELLERKVTDRGRISSVVFKLGDYVFYHLETEEDYLIKFGLSDVARKHILSHKAFRKNVEGFLSRIQNKNSNIEALTEEMVDFVIDWIQKHILTADKKYTKLLLARGVKLSEIANYYNLPMKKRRVRRKRSNL